MGSDRTYTLGQARVLTLTTKSLAGTDATTRTWTDRIKFANHGKKRTAILGYGWNIDGWENEVPLTENVYVTHYMAVNDNSEINRKYIRVTLNRISNYWFEAAGGGNVEPFPLPNDINGYVTYPQPYLIKKGLIEMGMTLSTNWAASNINARFFIWVADAILTDDMGDYYESTRLNRGWRRCKQVGETRICPSKKQGWV